MPSLTRLAVYAVAMIAITGFSPAAICTVASPLPDSVSRMTPAQPSQNRRMDQLLSRIRRTRQNDSSVDPPSVNHALAAADGPYTRAADPYQSLKAYSVKSSQRSKNLKTLAARSAYVSDSDADFHQEAASELTAYQADYSGYLDILRSLAADKGLLNFSPDDPVQVILKNIVNENKNALSATYILVKNLPVLGPILGPIVYEIKCITDEILNVVENVTDGLLNPLKPLLLPLYTALTLIVNKSCASGVSLIGICLDATSVDLRTLGPLLNL